MFESLKTLCTPFLPVIQKPLPATVQADASFPALQCVSVQQNPSTSILPSPSCSSRGSFGSTGPGTECLLWAGAGTARRDVLHFHKVTPGYRTLRPPADAIQAASSVNAEGTQCCTSLQLTGDPAACHQVTCKTQLLKQCTSCLTLYLLSFLTLSISFSSQIFPDYLFVKSNNEIPVHTEACASNYVFHWLSNVLQQVGT